MRDNRLIVLLSVLILGVLLGGYALAIYPQQQRKAQRLKEEAKMTEALLQTAQEQLSRTQASLAELLREGVPVYVPSQGGWPQTMAELMGGIDQWVRKTGVTLTKLEPEALEERPPLFLHPFLVEFTGGFWEVRAFMDALEQRLRMVPIQWAIEAEVKGAVGVKATCKAVVYEWGGKVLTPPLPEGRPVESMDLAGRRDPFSRVKASYTQTMGRTHMAALELSGIVDIGGRRKAIINGKPLGVGDLVGGKRILSITGDQVVLEGEPSPLKIRRPVQVVSPGASE